MIAGKCKGSGDQRRVPQKMQRSRISELPWLTLAGLWRFGLVPGKMVVVFLPLLFVCHQRLLCFSLFLFVFSDSVIVFSRISSQAGLGGSPWASWPDI